MEFVLYCLDRPEHAALRTQLRPAHLAYAAARPQAFRFGGPLLDDAGQPRGSLMILELPNRAALHEHMTGDPFFASALFASVDIWVTRQVMPEREVGALSRETAAAQRLNQPGFAAGSALPGAPRPS